MTIRILMLMVLTASILPFFLFGCKNTGNTEREHNVIPKASIPPIDTSVPANTETATFALG
ncbi:hypothetical protein ACFLU1_01565 [Chloroflexota bacterium]